MTKRDHLTKSIDQAEQGPQIGAFFDFDGTLISGFSALMFMREHLRQGHVSRTDLFELLAEIVDIAIGLSDVPSGIASGTKMLDGVSERSHREFSEHVYEKHLSRLIYPESRALIEAHLRKNHTVVIASSATIYQIKPAAEALGIEHILCTTLEVKRGKLTGAVVGRPCWGTEKLARVEAFASKTAINLDRSYFYTDGFEDADLLARVGNPRVLNPDKKLEEIAQLRGWPVRRFPSRGMPNAMEYLRSIGVYTSLVGSSLLGLAVWQLSGSKNEGRNATVSLWADVASALIGLEVDVSGEENLWANRPGVVIFNHQSQADALVAIKILKGNFAAVGKKEIKNLPLVSQALQFIGVIPIDRQNTKSAIESMKPLLDAMHKEGRFAVVAVEGTRSVSAKPGPFKKGAFHIAMQAGVPIIPLVIHNAIDVQPKGDFVFRPATVKAEILKPIDASKWKVENLDRHVAEVRNLYLKTLGFPEEPLPAPKTAAAKPKSRPRPKAKTLAASGTAKTASDKPSRKAATRKKRAKTRPQ